MTQEQVPDVPGRGTPQFPGVHVLRIILVGSLKAMCLGLSFLALVAFATAAIMVVQQQRIWVMVYLGIGLGFTAFAVWVWRLASKISRHVYQGPVTQEPVPEPMKAGDVPVWRVGRLIILGLGGAGSSLTVLGLAVLPIGAWGAVGSMLLLLLVGVVGFALVLARRRPRAT